MTTRNVPTNRKMAAVHHLCTTLHGKSSDYDHNGVLDQSVPHKNTKIECQVLET